MAIRLEGFVDNGKGAPLPNISAIVTRVDDGGIVTSGLTDAEGHWSFSGLSELEEYFVNLADGAGNAIVRGPWSGEMREAWIRDRLALPDTGLAVLPNGGNTTVGGLPLVLDPNPANVLAWTPTGIFSAGAVGLSQELADTLYEPIDSAYTKAESDALFLTEAEADLLYSPIDAVVDAWTKAESDLRYEPIDTMYTKVESDARYPQKTDVDPYPTYLTAAEADALFLTPAEGNAAYATSAHNHDTTYVQLSGGSVMTGLLGPTSNNTRDLGTTALRWRKLWAVDAEFTNAPTVGGSALLTATAADALFLTPAEGNTAYATAAHNHDASYVQLAGGSVMTGLLGPSTHNTRDLGTTGTRWRALYGMTGDLTTSLTVATKPVAISPDASNIVEWRSNGFYAAAGAVSDIWVNTTGDTMTGDLNMTANVLPTVTNVRSLGSTSLRWLKVWATDADFTNAPTVGGSALLTATAADALFLTPTEGNAAYATLAHNHDASYVQLVGGSVMTGLLGPTTTNTRDLGTTALRWRKLWAVDGEFTNAPTVGGVAVLTATSAGLLYEPLDSAYTKSEDDARFVNLAGGSVMTGLLGPTTTNTRDLGTTALRWRKLWAVDADLSGVITAPTRGHQIGTLGVSALYSAPMPDTDASIFLYRTTSSNWAGLGVDGSGNAWLRTGTSGTPVPPLAVTATGVVMATVLQVNTRPVIMAGCRVYHTANQTITTATVTALAFNSERYDTDAYHDPVTLNTRLTVPSGHAGKYLIWATVSWSPVADTTLRFVGLRLNGSTHIGRQGGPNLNSATFGVFQNLSVIYDLAVGDYIEVVVRHERGSNLDVIFNANIDPEFGLHRVG